MRLTCPTRGRDQAVVVNLRLDSDETRLLGVEGHVCELQLLLAALEPPEVRVRVCGPCCRT